MSDGPAFLFGVHNHQPVGNFDSVVHEATALAYDPFLRCLSEGAAPPVTVHCSGGLLAWLREHARATFDRLGALAAAGRVELLTGGFYEPVLAMLPDADKVGQVQALTEFLRREFGVRARGMWLAERVWEPQLPRVLREAGVEFALVDDEHFAMVGMSPESLGGYYLTEDQGATLALFPISQRLRYLVPFADPGDTVRYLAERAGAGAITLVDDGEKLGVWPGTHKLCYEERWLARFFEALAAAPGIGASTFSRYLDAAPASGRVYLPTASYREMGEWALPAEAGAALEIARERLAGQPDGDGIARMLRGGFWRSFLVKYPEISDAYWRMLALSRRLHAALAARPGDAALLEAREQLWRGQANDAYWHGVFGGTYLPHLRRAVRSSLAGAERQLVAAGALAPGAADAADMNGDGDAEVRVRTAELAVTVAPAAGGTLSELLFYPVAMDVADVLTRRPEAYHRRLKEAESPGASQGEARSIHDRLEAKESGLGDLVAYDAFRRVSLLAGLFDAGAEPLDALHPWPAARVATGGLRLRHELREADGGPELRLAGPPGSALAEPLEIEKVVGVPRAGARVRVDYRLRWRGAAPLRARWAVQLNLTLTAGDAEGRYYRLPGQPSLGSRGALDGRSDVEMVDEWLGAEVRIEWTPAAHLGWAPVETVSLSEAGLERIYQGSALLIAWTLDVAPGGVAPLALELSLRRR